MGSRSPAQPAEGDQGARQSFSPLLTMGTWGSSTTEAAHAWRAGCTALGKPAYSGNEVDCAGHEGSHMKLLRQLHLRHIQTLPARSPARPQCQRSAATSYPRFSEAQRAGEQSTCTQPSLLLAAQGKKQTVTAFLHPPGELCNTKGQPNAQERSPPSAAGTRGYFLGYFSRRACEPDGGSSSPTFLTPRGAAGHLSCHMNAVNAVLCAHTAGVCGDGKSRTFFCFFFTKI